MCIELKCHPYFIVPYMSVDPQTDWLSSLDNYIKANAPAWMIPRYEGPNENWNSFDNFYAYDYAILKTTAQWGTSNDGIHHWYGRVISEIGQTIATSRGNDRTKYNILCGVQSSEYPRASAQDARLEGPRGRGPTKTATFSNGTGISVPGNTYALNDPVAFVVFSSADNPPTVGGTPLSQLLTYYVKTTGSTITLSASSGGAAMTFTIVGQTVFGLTPAASPAKNWVTHVCCTGYVNPTTQNQLSELVSGFNYLTTGSSSYVDAYAGSNTITTNTLKTSYNAWKAWSVSHGVGGLTQYEGGWSPDYIESFKNWTNQITAVSKTTVGNFNTVLTLADLHTPGFEGTGHGFTVGMPLCGLTVTSMPQLESPAVNVWMTAGTPGVVDWGSAHGFSVGQPVTFGAKSFLWDSSGFDCPVTPGIAYYVKTTPTANTFTVSLTPSGAAVPFAFANSDIVSVSKCWIVTAVTATTVTINCDSSSFSNFVAGGNQRATYGCYGGPDGGTGTAAMLNIIRARSKEAASLRADTLKNYNDFIAEGGVYPSVYIFAGSRTAWPVWDPDVYRGTTPPQWLGVIDFNP
jgi:hypothetical protein